MPIPNKTIRAEDAGVFLPGTKVTSAHRKEAGICIIPSAVAIEGMPRYDAVYVCWPNGDAEWVYPQMLSRL
ncbi:hypothetical protein ABIB86_000414 [Bradyrhizobium sp. JR1.7]